MSQANGKRLLLLVVALYLSACNHLWAETHEVYPETYSGVFSAFKEPVLRVKSGDAVITRTWDAFGQDYKDVRHIPNPFAYPELRNALMGPFYIEGADYGDSLEVHLDRVRLNRNWGWTSYRLSPAFLDPHTRGLYRNTLQAQAVRPELR